MSTMCILATHSPRLINKEKVEPIFKELYDGMITCGEELQEFNPDVIVVLTTHWFTTFNIYANGTPIQSGIYTAPEAPETINRVMYKFNGDPELAQQIVDGGLEAGIPCMLANDETMMVDYGTILPVNYFDPSSEIPVVSLSISMNSSIEEYIQFGKTLAKTFEKSGKRIAFVASGSLAHWHSRNPADWPPQEMQDMDKEVINGLESGNLEKLKGRLGHIAKTVRMEGYGYHIASLIGVLEGLEHEEHRSNMIVYGPSSGTGNACMTFTPTK